MAIPFCLWVQCRTADAIQLLASHFRDWTYTNLNGEVVGCDVDTETQSDKYHCAMICPSRLGDWGIRKVKHAVDSTEAGLRLFHRLLTAPPFAFARVGWDADTISIADLPDYIEELREQEKYLPLECVLDNSLHDELGQPVGFFRFRPGYVWKTYSGEVFYALGSSDFPELDRLKQALFTPLVWNSQTNNYQ